MVKDPNLDPTCDMYLPYESALFTYLRFLLVSGESEGVPEVVLLYEVQVSLLQQSGLSLLRLVLVEVAVGVTRAVRLTGVPCTAPGVIYGCWKSSSFRSGILLF